MARKLFVYDDEARRQLQNRNFVSEFESKRVSYIERSQQFYSMLATNPARLPLKADIQALLAEYLYASAEFTNLILDKVGSLETRHTMWCGCFAAMVVELAWDEIKSPKKEAKE